MVKGFRSAIRWTIVGRADGGEGGSVRRYNERIEERTVAVDGVLRPTWSMGTMDAES